MHSRLEAGRCSSRGAGVGVGETHLSASRYLKLWDGAKQEAVPTAAHCVTQEGGGKLRAEDGEEAQGSPRGRSLGGQACRLHQLVLS